MNIDQYRAAYNRSREYEFQKQSTSSATGYWVSLWNTSGRPEIGTRPTEGSESLNYDTPGGLNFMRAPAGRRSVLLKASNRRLSVGSIYLYDRLVHTQLYNASGNQTHTISTVPLPSRAGNGEGVELWLEFGADTTTADTLATIEIEYTNSVGVSGRTTSAINFPVRMRPHTALRMPLQAGDSGIRSVQKITIVSTWTTSTIAVVLAKRVTSMRNIVAGVPVASGLLDTQDPVFTNDMCIYMVIGASTTTSGAVNVTLTMATVEE